MIKTSLITLAMLLLVCITNSPGMTDRYLDSGHEKETSRSKAGVPELHIDTEGYTHLKSLFFKDAVTGKNIEQETFVAFKYSPEFLEIKFECRDNPRMEQNYYTTDNQPLYQQEVFEVFIHPGREPGERYWEIQLNPNNAIFLAKVINRYKSDKSFDLEMIDNALARIEHTVQKDLQKKTWKGTLTIPLELIRGSKGDKENVFRMNMFRIISNQDHEDPEWSNNEQNATFACWSSPMTEVPRFHEPESFGFLYLGASGKKHDEIDINNNK